MHGPSKTALRTYVIFLNVISRLECGPSKTSKTAQLTRSVYVVLSTYGGTVKIQTS